MNNTSKDIKGIPVSGTASALAVMQHSWCNIDEHGIKHERLYIKEENFQEACASTTNSVAEEPNLNQVIDNSKNEKPLSLSVFKATQKYNCKETKHRSAARTIEEKPPSDADIQIKQEYDGDYALLSVKQEELDIKVENLEEACSSESRFYCTLCNYKCFQKYELIRHQMIHTDEKPFSCALCDYKCSRKDQLIRHHRKHTGEKPFCCSVCDYKCTRKDALSNHERTHTSEKPFSCTFCDYKCAQKGVLVNHQRSHTGEKPFSCTLCDYKCAQKGVLITHRRIHTGEKPFSCGSCDYTCARKSQLQRHKLVHTSDKPFRCTFCDYKCNEKFQLARHQKIHRN